MKRKLNLILGALLQTALCLSLAVVFAPRLSAQNTYGSIAGTVADSSGAAISDAQVTLANVDTGEKRVQQSGTDGLYSFVNLLPGRYRIDVEKTGFKRIARPEVIVEVGQVVRIDLALQVGEVTQTIEVTGE
ncbi:MAG TPA: carboxypeptidase-like regulatory domain-containing protein, partial [Candidatus Sulfotelmatobacter sp.]|nr:carboxypeptidase-like regulatory domain-containing protein [Candidatus Sulfotelmatobacter sp.]